MYTNRMRMTGSSGMDIDSIVTNLMKAESQSLYKAQREVILLSWRQEAYRNTAKTLNTFKSTYLDSLGAKKMNLPSTYKNFTSSVKTSGGSTSDAVKVTTSSTAAEGEYKVSVLQTATAASITGSQKVVSSTGTEDSYGKNLLDTVLTTNGNAGQTIYKDVPVQEVDEDGELVVDDDGNPVYVMVDSGEVDDENQAIMVPKTESVPDGDKKTEGFSFSVTYDGVTKKIDLSDIDKVLKDDPAALAMLKDENADITDRLKCLEGIINDKLDAAFGTEYTDKATADQIIKGDQTALDKDGNSIVKAKMSISLTEEGITFEGSSRTFKISGLSSAGIKDGESNAMGTSGALSDLIGNVSSVSINGATIAVKDGMTVKNFMDAINNSDAGVKVTLDSVNQCFKIASTKTGEASSITFDDSDTADAMKNVFGISGEVTAGKDSIIQVNGRTVQSSSNTVSLDSVDGVILTLKDTTVDAENKVNEITITVSKDNDTLINNIKDFINGYNDMIKSLQTELKTGRPKSDSYNYYEPLLENEKEGLSESEITKLEEKAKTGLLYNDPLLANIVNGMRAAMNTKIDLGDGRSLSLYEIGITTSSDTTKGAQLEIDETKLKNAIEKYGDDIAKLFTGNGTTKGIANLVSDEVDKATSSSKIKTGTLTLKAGIEGYSSATDNYFYNILKQKNERIESMLKALEKKEDAYYSKFSAMEQAMSSADSQLSSLMSALGM